MNLEDRTRRELQYLAKQYGIKANMKSIVIIQQLKSLMKQANDVKWFIDENINFSIGIELYKGGFPIVSGDDVRTFMKVYIRGFPNRSNIICQLFYLSSGKNSAMSNLWLPTDIVNFRYDVNVKVWEWYIQKKPWFIGSTTEDGKKPSMRFGGDPTVGMVSVILGGGERINAIKKYVSLNLKKHLVKLLGNKNGNDKYENITIYYERMSKLIQQYLTDKQEGIQPECDEYDLDMWIDNCNSYNWFAPFDERYPNFIPNLDPSSKDSLWGELPEKSPGKGKLFLSNQWLNSRKITMDYINAKKDKDNGFPSAKSELDKIKRGARFRQLQNNMYMFTKKKFPDNLATRDELLERSS